MPLEPRCEVKWDSAVGKASTKECLTVLVFTTALPDCYLKKLGCLRGHYKSKLGMVKELSGMLHKKKQKLREFALSYKTKIQEEERKPKKPKQHK